MGGGGGGGGEASWQKAARGVEGRMTRTLALMRPTNRWRRASNDPSAWTCSRTASVSADDDFGTSMRHEHATNRAFTAPPEDLQTCTAAVTVCLAIHLLHA